MKLSRPPLSRLYTDASTTQGLRTISSLRYVDMTALTVAMWVWQTATPGGTRRAVEAGTNAGSNGWGIRPQNTGKAQLASPRATSNKTCTVTSALAANAWTHLIFRDTDLSATGATMDAIVNGVVDAGVTTNGAGAHNTGTATALGIGTGSAAGTTSPPWLIAHVAIWLRKIGDLEGLDLFSGAWPTDFRQGLIGWWAMDGRNGHGYEPDLSGMGLPLFSHSSGATQWGQQPPRDYRVIRPRGIVVPAAVAGVKFPMPLMYRRAA